jgi:hypothetical protein
MRFDVWINFFFQFILSSFFYEFARRSSRKSSGIGFVEMIFSCGSEPFDHGYPAERGSGEAPGEDA